MNLIFVACTGRCGASNLTDYFNIYGKNCYAELEPPNLIYKNKWPLGNIARNIQRKWIVTHEELGRGKALLWYDNDENEKLEKLARKRLKKINKLKCKHYVELSKFFIRSYCDAIYRLQNDIGVLMLYRNPLRNARSFVNRNKNFSLDGVMPFFKKACFKIDINKLTKYQLYLWQWVEIDLRFQRYIKNNNIENHYRLKTEDLDDPTNIEKLFELFGITFDSPIRLVKPKNTNVAQGRSPTVVSSNDIEEFYQFLEMIPEGIMRKVKHIKEYCP